MQNHLFDKPTELLRAILTSNGLSFCEYRAAEDLFILYDDSLKVKKTIPQYLSYIENSPSLHPEDRWRLKEFILGKTRGEMEVRVIKDEIITKQLLHVYPSEDMDLSRRFLFMVRDITFRKNREILLEERAMKDSLTMLYNHFSAGN